jgi:hypothetical protein
MEKQSKPRQRLGKVLKGEYGPFIALGRNDSGDEKYHYDVEITVKDKAGNVLVKQVNGFIGMYNPRKSDFLTEEQKAKLPENLQFELSIIK